MAVRSPRLLYCSSFKKLDVPSTFQMPFDYPKYIKEDYDNMPEWKLDYLLEEYGLLVLGTLCKKLQYVLRSSFGTKPSNSVKRRGTLDWEEARKAKTRGEGKDARIKREGGDAQVECEGKHRVVRCGVQATGDTTGHQEDRAESRYSTQRPKSQCYACDR
ncbi:hypothetical protein L7F22_001838 [Adiantum nelumboides]|nr:hypothetical protein [Adiantum nelumboides]